MKTLKKIFKVVVLVVLTLGLTSCSKEQIEPPIQVIDTDKDGIADADDNCPSEAGPASNQGCPNTSGDGQITENDGITEEDLETYKGDIGLVIDARELAKKGYKPVQANLKIEGTSNDYSKTLVLDEYSFMGQIKLPVQDLSPEDLSKLTTDGVKVIAELLDTSGTKIIEQTFNQLFFKSNALPTNISGNALPDLNTEIDVIPNTPYYIQLVKNGTPQGSATFRRVLGDNPTFNNLLSSTSSVEFTGIGTEDQFLFYFEPIEGKENHFNIKHLDTDSYLKNVQMTTNVAGVNIDLGYRGIKTGFDKSGQLNQQFVLWKEGYGEYRMTDAFYTPIQLSTGIGFTIGEDSGEDLRFRLVSMNIDWEIQEIETRYLEPLLPAAQNGFSYNSTLINCGSGSLEQTIGESKNVSTETTVGWEETISIMSSHTAGASLTLGLEVGASFFGNGATYSAEATGSYEYTTQNAMETSNWTEATGIKSETFFSERKITVPPKSAVLAYDAFQQYTDVKVNIVQRIQVKGREHTTASALSGREIASQFHFNGFDGVITQIGPDYVQVTLRGIANMDQVFKSKSDVQEVSATCSN